MPPRKSASKIERARQYLSGGTITREDSDDELGYDDLPWEWIYEDGKDAISGSKKRKRASTASSTGAEIVGARMGSFVCKLGDTVFLKSADQQAWVGIICDFVDDEETGEKMADFMWFSTPDEIRNKTKKRTDLLKVSESIDFKGRIAYCSLE
jgi:origin recognition complex subunit 1